MAIQFVFLSGYPREKNAFEIYPTNDQFIYDICFTINGGALGIADNNEIKVYATSSRNLLNEFKNGHRDRILSIDISMDSTLMVSGGKDSSIVVWDFITGAIIKTLNYHQGIITSVKISSDGRYIASGGSDKKIFLFDINADHLVYESSAHTRDLCAVTFSPDGKITAAAGGDRMISIYNSENGDLITSLTGHKNWVRDISFSQDATKLISCGDDGRVITWNLTDINNIYKSDEKKEAYNWLLSIDNMDDGKTYVTGGVNGIARIVGLYGAYKVRIGVPVTRLLFKPNSGSQAKIAIASGGKGVIMVDARLMDYHSK